MNSDPGCIPSPQGSFLACSNPLTGTRASNLAGSPPRSLRVWRREADGPKKARDGSEDTRSNKKCLVASKSGRLREGSPVSSEM